MNKITAFAGSNSKKSINKQLVTYVASKLLNAEVTILDLNDFELPLFGIDLEIEKGIPEAAHRFLSILKESDGLVVSLAEHNGAYSTAFKNIFDWMSRIDGKLWSNIPMLLMATSPGGRGGASVLAIAIDRFPRMGANIVSTFSLPSFGLNFSEEGISDPNFNEQFEVALSAFEATLQ